jgi:integrase
MALTVKEVDGFRASEKPRKHFDQDGLYLLVQPSGSKWWRFKYRYGGKEKLLSIGTYPEVGLKEARDKVADHRASLRAGADPSATKKAAKETAAGADSFEFVGREWLEKESAKWTSDTAERIKTRLENDVFPWLGKEPIGSLRAPKVLQTLRRIEARGAHDTAHRAMQEIGRIFRYAVATGRAERDPTADLRGALTPAIAENHASITDPKEAGALLRAIEGYQGGFIARCALRVAPLVFVRPGELRGAEWSEFDLDGAEWRIPAERMKMRNPHIVPLSKQALAILRELHELTSASSKYVFPSTRSWERPMSENTVLAALRGMGYASGVMTGHGFRSMASTMLNELGWNRDAIEAQLAHTVGGVRGAYNYAQYLPERRKMMQAWADHLDALRDSKKVVAIRGGGKAA